MIIEGKEFKPFPVLFYTHSELAEYLQTLHQEVRLRQISTPRLFEICKYSNIRITSLSNNSVSGSYHGLKFTIQFVHDEIVFTYAANSYKK